MLWSALTASIVIFAVLFVWVLVDRWFKRLQQEDPDDCNIRRTECGHCLMMDTCVHRDETVSNKAQDNGSVAH